MKKCSVDNCERPHKADGLCELHRRRAKAGTDLHRPLRAERAQIVPFIEAAIASFTDKCIPWPYGNLGNGYPVYTSLKPENDGSALVHRYVCRRVYGAPDDRKMVAAHSCGNGHLGCINPRHLRWASTKENVRDMIEHGTQAVGSKLPQSKVTAPQVLEIRAIYERGGVSQREIGLSYGLTQGGVTDIIRRKNWKHI